MHFDMKTLLLFLVLGSQKSCWAIKTDKFTCQFLLLLYTINKFSFTIFHRQGFLVHVDDQQVSLDKFRWLKINNILATFSLLSVYTSKFLTWQFFLVKEKLARQIFLDKENLSTIPRLHEQFFLVKANLSRKNCSCKWGFSNKKKAEQKDLERDEWSRTD